ncbi:MAG: LacI family transcriptional regulator [Propionibacteriaceae bacterium]|jgi:DNA-binding LacI/PurR family transcriptional regulator|nr:LacI family transcriptional regulator [Propionibacteriaceae bacterium]
MARITMQSVADRAGVSKTAVSLAFNDPGRLAEGTVKRILALAGELGYVPDAAARALRTSRTSSLGLLLPQQLDVVLSNPYHTEFLMGVGNVCHQEGYTLLLVPPVRGSMLRAIPSASVDGFIVSGMDEDRGEIQTLRQREVPFVLVDSCGAAGAATVLSDDATGMEELVTHVLELGHRRITLVRLMAGEDENYQYWRSVDSARMRGAVAALGKFGMGVEDVDIAEAYCTRQSGIRVFGEIWDAEQRPTAIVAFSDIIALGILDSARERGVRVPEDVTVTGFDDIAEAGWSAPPLTTVRQPIATKGRLAAEYLVESLREHREHGVNRHQLPVTLEVRGSSGPPRKNGSAARNLKPHQRSLAGA